MNLYLRELKAHRKSIIIWSLSMMLLIMGGVGKYTAGAATGANSFNDMIAEMPKSLKNLMGVGVFDLSKLVDYFGILYLYLALMLTIHAVMLGNGIIAKEERDKTAEFLLVKPISRRNIVTSKLLAALTNVIIMNLVTWVTTVGVFSKVSKGEDYAIPVFHMMLGLLGMQIFFLALGSLLAAGLSRYKISSPIATGILLGMYFLSVTIDISGKIDFLKWVTVFKYFDAKDILKNGYNFIFLLLALLLTSIFTFGTYHFYKGRDMKI